MAFFPLVGTILGCLVACFVWAAWDLWPPYLSGPLGCAWLAFLTRGLHLDGFADMADALGSGAAPERALEIMRDSRSGALGVAALVFLIVLKSSAFIFFISSRDWQWLVMAPCCSRWGLNVLASVSSYARPQGGLGESFTGKGTRIYLLLAGPTALAVGWFLLGWKGLMVVVATAIWSLLFAIFSRSRFGGVTGDILGAHVELSETMILLLGVALE